MILKNKTQGSFVIVSQSIMHDQSLKLFDRGLLVTLMSLPDNWVFNIAGLANILSDGRDAISGGINRLIDQGYLIIEQLRVNGKFSENCLRINVIANESDQEEPDSEEPITENPSTDKSPSGKSMTEIPAQLNNKESSNNKSSDNQSKKNICHISDRKEFKNGADNGKQGFAYKPSGKRWTKDEIDLYGL